MGEVNEDMLEPRSGSRPKAIAIIGMACRLPAGANNVENLWTSLASGQSGWSPHPTERYLPDKYYHPNPDKRGTYYSKGAHYLDEDIALFDPQFFNITAAEATVSSILKQGFSCEINSDSALLRILGNGPATTTFARGEL